MEGLGEEAFEAVLVWLERPKVLVEQDGRLLDGVVVWKGFAWGVVGMPDDVFVANVPEVSPPLLQFAAGPVHRLS